MSHIYQPLMLKTMLRQRGSATIREIAIAFLTSDESQIDMTSKLSKPCPGVYSLNMESSRGRATSSCSTRNWPR